MSLKVVPPNSVPGLIELEIKWLHFFQKTHFFGHGPDPFHLAKALGGGSVSLGLLVETISLFESPFPLSN